MDSLGGDVNKQNQLISQKWQVALFISQKKSHEKQLLSPNSEGFT
jgi:hypothetical protein